MRAATYLSTTPAGMDTPVGVDSVLHDAAENVAPASRLAVA
jgi:hypothetical protein